MSSHLPSNHSVLSAATVITVNSVQAVVGLTWLTAMQGEKLSKVAQATAMGSGAQWKALYGSADQYGLAVTPLPEDQDPVRANETLRRTEGRIHRAPAAAAALAAVLPNAWMGAWPVYGEDGVAYWLAKAEDRQIAPGEGDLVLTRLADAQHIFDLWRESAEPEVKIYAPQDWGVDQADSTPLEHLLRRSLSKAPRVLRATATSLPSGRALYRVVMIALVLAAAGHWAGATRWLFAPPATETAEPQPPPPPPSSWSAVRPADWLQRCMDTLDTLYRTVPGWRPTKVSCTRLLSSVQYSAEPRERGPVGSAGRAATPVGRPETLRFIFPTEAVTFEARGSVATVSMPLDLRNAKRRTVHPLMRVADAQELLWSYQARTGDTIDVTDGSPAPAALEMPATTGSPTRMLSQTGFTVHATMSPLTWLGALDAIPGLVVSGVSRTMPAAALIKADQKAGATETSLWTITGAVDVLH